ncbi:hypothetical protein D3C72_1320450 [compost metagenome]
MKSLGQTIGVAVFGVLINQHISSAAEASRKQGTAVSQDDINKLLSPEKIADLPKELWNTLRHFLEGGLHLLFIIMAVIALFGALSVLGLRSKPPGTEETSRGQAGAK